MSTTRAELSKALIANGLDLGSDPQAKALLDRFVSVTEEVKEYKRANGEVADNSFKAWLQNVLPVVAKSLGIVASAVVKVVNAVLNVVNLFN